MNWQQIEVTGHRGAAAIEPENTLRGIRYALSLELGRIEIDVHLSRDGELIVMHDATVDRTTNGTGKIAELTAAEIKLLDAGKGEPVPTFQEVISVFQESWAQGGTSILQIELKGPGTAAPIVDAIRRNGAEERCVVSSFDAGRVAEAKTLLPQITADFITSKLEPDPVEIAQRISATAVHLRHDLATRELVQRFHDAGLRIIVWNIDEIERMKWAASLGVDGISSNNPQLLCEVLAGRH
jgi:glycerophosphoryl diester phosphodiesterase